MSRRNPLSLKKLENLEAKSTRRRDRRREKALEKPTNKRLYRETILNK